MAGIMKNANKYPEVVKNPTRYTGGKNAAVYAEKNPTRYTGGLNAPATVGKNPTKYTGGKNAPAQTKPSKY